MRLATGKVVQGRVELIGDSLDEGTVVTVAVPDEKSFQLDAESEAALLQSIEEADRGELVPAEEVFRKLDEQR